MKFLSTFVLVICCKLLIGQDISDVKNYKSSGTFNVVRDSILKLINPLESISIVSCSRYREIHLVKDNSGWKGYEIHSLIIGDFGRGSISRMDENGVEHIEKEMITSLTTFNADSLYEKLIRLKILDVKQFSEQELEDKLNVNLKNRGKVRTSLTYGSHDCNMIISLMPDKLKTVTYRNSIIQDERMYFIPTIAIFKEVKSCLYKIFPAN